MDRQNCLSAQYCQYIQSCDIICSYEKVIKVYTLLIVIEVEILFIGIRIATLYIYIYIYIYIY